MRNAPESRIVPSTSTPLYIRIWLVASTFWPATTRKNWKIGSRIPVFAVPGTHWARQVLEIVAGFRKTATLGIESIKRWSSQRGGPNRGYLSINPEVLPRF